MKKSGFTLVELLAVILILSLLMVIAVPSIMAISKKMNERGLDSKIELIEDAAVLYAQNNSNTLKNELGECNSNSEHCECASTDETGASTDCKYVFTITLDELIKEGVYDSESDTDDPSVCDVTDPRDKSNCLDCATITVKLDDEYKTANAYFDKDGITTKTVCD